MLLLVGSPLAAQDPWSKVPALPSGFPAACYRDNDTFEEDAGTVQSENLAAIDRQKETNQGLRQQFWGLDPSAQQARLMAYIQKNPGGATQAVQQLQSFGAGTESFPEIVARGTEFETELKKLMDDFKADPEVQQMGRIHTLMVEQPGLYKQYDELYLRVCRKWFIRPAGETEGAGEKAPPPVFRGFLARYREFLTGEYVAPQEKSDATNKQFLEAMGVPVATYRSTAAMEAVDKYLNAAVTIFATREIKPWESR